MTEHKDFNIGAAERVKITNLANVIAEDREQIHDFLRTIVSKRKPDPNYDYSSTKKVSIKEAIEAANNLCGAFVELTGPELVKYFKSTTIDDEPGIVILKKMHAVSNELCVIFEALNKKKNPELTLEKYKKRFDTLNIDDLEKFNEKYGKWVLIHNVFDDLTDYIIKLLNHMFIDDKMVVSNLK